MRYIWQVVLCIYPPSLEYHKGIMGTKISLRTIDALNEFQIFLITLVQDVNLKNN